MTIHRDWSLRRRLLIWLMAPLLVLSVLLLLDAFRNARNATDQAYDRLIAASALAIADRVVASEGQLDIDLPYVALEMLATEADDRVFYRISDPEGEFVTGYPDLPEAAAADSNRIENPHFFDAQYRGQEVRIVQYTQPVTGPGIAGDFSVLVAQTRGERDVLTRELATDTGIRLLVMIALVGLITWFGVRFGLAPLEALRGEIRRRSPEDLRPLEVQVPKEVRDLVGAINVLMRRLASSLASMERFIADAAHQLRTPLSALQTQVETALRTQEPAAQRSCIAELQAVTWRTSRLASQLLSDTRSAAYSATSPRKPIDLSNLAAEVARLQVPAALQRGIDLGFEGDQAADLISGDEVLLQEAVTNVIDNALKYCPAGSSVTVRQPPSQDPGSVILEVIDDGPGIPAADRERVFERFYRLSPSTQEGSGLGLAIVRAIVEGHGGSISLLEGETGGLLVRMEFPALNDGKE